MPRTLAAAFLALAFVALLAPAPATAAKERPVLVGAPSDAESIVLLHAYVPGYWWDHTDLTVAVQSAPNVDPIFVSAIRDAIATWSRALARYFPTVTLTDTPRHDFLAAGQQHPWPLTAAAVDSHRRRR